MGAWIEIPRKSETTPNKESLLSWERGLKYLLQVIFPPLLPCRSSRGSVDWNLLHQAGLKYSSVAPLVGAWIEIYMVEVKKALHHVAPLVGAWIEI